MRRIGDRLRDMASNFFNLERPHSHATGSTLVRETELHKHEDFHSQYLDEDRTLIVFLPPGYDKETERRYPVLYLHDGQNLFDVNTAFGGRDWRADETAYELIEEKKIEPLVIVGVYNTEGRLEEYTPTPDKKLGGGKADLYGKALVEEIKPFIDKTYRTRDCAWNTGLGGSSLGGLVTLYLGLRYPHIFGKLAILSPSVWWNDRAIVQEVEAIEPRPRLKIWLDMGTQESESGVADAEALRDALETKGWIEGDDLMYTEIRGATHSEDAWSKRVGPFLEYLFPAN